MFLKVCTFLPSQRVSVWVERRREGAGERSAEEHGRVRISKLRARLRTGLVGSCGGNRGGHLRGVSEDIIASYWRERDLGLAGDGAKKALFLGDHHFLRVLDQDLLR